MQPAGASSRLAYDDPDSAGQMASDATACRAEAHLAAALDLLAGARRTAEAVPGALLQAPVAVGRTAARTTLSISEQAARFAARLLD